MKKILFATSECVPFIKTGGLADVAGALPKAFNKDEFDVRVILPNYLCIPEKFRNEFEYLGHFYLGLGGKFADTHCGIMRYQLDGITYYFIDNLFYFGGEKPYGDIRGDVEKFTFFSKAVLSVLKTIDFRPDLIHCHDWQTGFIPVYLKNQFADDPYYHNIKTVFTIHNLKFQGVWDIKTMKEISGFDDYLFTPDKLEYKRDANMLKGGLTYSDYITTVSETYAQEIQTEEYGEGMEGLLQARHFDMQGIVNGIDYDYYNPQADEEIPHSYYWRALSGKKKNKEELQKKFGLEVRADVPVIAMISRLASHKGFDLVRAVFDEMMQDDVQFVLLGTGEAGFEDFFREAAKRYPGKASINLVYNRSLSKLIYAGADLFLMPSKSEACGLSQMICSRYGAVPIVRETGGLKDTVEAYNEYENTGTGFSFANYNAHEMLYVINYAKSVWQNNKKAWQAMMKRAMKADFSWDNSAKSYIEVYNYLLGSV